MVSSGMGYLFDFMACPSRIRIAESRSANFCDIGKAYHFPEFLDVFAIVLINKLTMPRRHAFGLIVPMYVTMGG